jgi:hypothetical protein
MNYARHRRVAGRYFKFDYACKVNVRPRRHVSSMPYLEKHQHCVHLSAAYRYFSMGCLSNLTQRNSKPVNELTRTRVSYAQVVQIRCIASGRLSHTVRVANSLTSQDTSVPSLIGR